jgi:hypothetical protein
MYPTPALRHPRPGLFFYDTCPRPTLFLIWEGDPAPRAYALERVMNSIRNGLGMRETEIVKEPTRLWNPHFYAIFARVHNTL